MSSIAKLLYQFQDTLFYAVLDSDDRTIIDTALRLANDDQDLKESLYPQAYARMIEIINMSVDNLKLIKEAGKNMDLETPTFKKHVACTSYSCGTNLSKDYQFANNIDFASCSNSSVSGMYCMSALSPTKCPFYSPDESLYASYQFSHEGTNYDYSVHTYRHIYGDIHYQIFDQENNLINELKFDSLTHLSIDPTELAIELKSIVKQVHHNIYYSQSSELSEIEIQKQDFIKNKKSYLATLIS
jgi:trans-2-enoyl-CoA reductase